MVGNTYLKEYLESWLDNVGRSSTPEETLADAMNDDLSLIEWGFKESKYDELDYDYDFALSCLK